MTGFRPFGLAQAPYGSREVEFTGLRFRHHAVEIPRPASTGIASGLAETMAMAIAACSRPMAMQALPGGFL
jgi:hypothetical protein